MTQVIFAIILANSAAACLYFFWRFLLWRHVTSIAFGFSVWGWAVALAREL